MTNIYEDVFSELIRLVQDSRDGCVQRMEDYSKAKGALLNLGDTRYHSYASMVETNQYRAVKAIERLVVLLFQKRNDPNFSFYPIAPRYSRMIPEEQAKTRPFQIILTENKVKCGIAFCVAEDEKAFSAAFLDGKFPVDKLKFIKIVDPNEEWYEYIIADDNRNNCKLGIHIEKATIREFWEQYFGRDEYDKLVAHINAFNEQARDIIGFSTIVTPTDTALARFRVKTGDMLRTHPYTANIPDNIYQHQIDIWTKNYIDRGLWRAMVGASNFAVSFITSEWNYNMYLLTENLDLAGIVAGYLKSVEQLIWTIIGFQTKQAFQIKAKSKYGGKVDFSATDKELIDSTLGSLEQVLKENPWMFDVNNFAKHHIIDAIDGWRQKHRNGYFHKHNLQSIDKVKEIREQTLQLYFLILGGCTIGDADFPKLGIETTT